MALRVTKDKAFSFDPSTLLTVVVGAEPNQKRFSMHESIICARSDFFRRAMSGDWLEKEGRLIKFPEDDPDIFALYVNVVYTNQVPTSATTETKTPEALRGEFHELCVLYVLCEKLMDKARKNLALRAIMSTGKEVASDGSRYAPKSESIAVMYAGTLAHTPARKLLVQMLSPVPRSSFLKNQHQLPRDFLVDFAAMLLETRPAAKKSWRDHESNFLEEVD